MHELSRIAELLKQSKDTEEKAKKRAEEAEMLAQKLKDQFMSGEESLKGLKEQIVLANQNLTSSTIQNKRLESIIVRLKAEEKELKRRNAELEQKVEDMEHEHGLDQSSLGQKTYESSAAASRI